MQGVSTIPVHHRTASNLGTYAKGWFVPTALPMKNQDTGSIVRPIEVDEWAHTCSSRIDGETPVTAQGVRQFHGTIHPFIVDNVVQLVHIPSNNIGLEFRL